MNNRDMANAVRCLRCVDNQMRTVVIVITMQFKITLNKGYVEINNPATMFKNRANMPIYQIEFFIIY